MAAALGLAAGALLWAGAGPSASAPPAPVAAAVPGEVLVGFRPDAGARDRAAAARDADAAVAGPAPAPGVARLRVEPGASTTAAMADLAEDPAVAWVAPNRYRQVTAAPDDPWFSDLWALQNRGQAVNGAPGVPGADIDVVAAWELAPSGPEPLVAVVDTGLAFAHPDLAGAVALNPGETGGGRESNGVDDDRNGFVDDWRGWDFAGRDNDASDTDGHGTHVAGTLAARTGNGVGVAGVAGGARILPLRVVGAHGATDADIASAFTYAARRGARVVNASLGGPGSSPVIDQAILAAPDTLFVFPAGNAANDNDVSPDFPCATEAPNALCVAATDPADLPAHFSGRGATTVDLAAPGTNVISTAWGAGALDYRLASGTSVAAPHVAGVAALVLRADPSAPVARVRAALLHGAEPLAALAGTSVTGGRLNALRSVQIALGLPPQASSAAGDPPAPDPVEAEPAVPQETRPLRAGAAPRRAGAGDLVAPRVRGLRLVRAGGRGRARVALRLRMSERAEARVTVTRRTARGLRRVRALRPRAVRAGTRGVALGRLAPGRYRVWVRAVDPAGNARTAARWISLRAAA